MEDEPEEKTRCQYCIAGCKQLTTFVLSHVGLVTLVVGYCIIGAFTFEALESGYEREVKEKMVKVREAVSQDLWLMTRKTDYIIPDAWAQNASKRLQDFEKELLTAIKKTGWDGSEDQGQLQWTFTGSLFYSIIVITTIGYGHIAPKTVWGKIVTIFYAIVGIPLMVVCWSHIGDFMANAFRFIYWKVCCYICTRKPKHRPRGHLRRGKSVRGSSKSAGSVKMKRSMRRSARVSQRSADSAMSDSVISTASDPAGYHYMEGGTNIQRHTANSSTLPRTTQPRSIHPQRYTHPRSAKSAEPDIANPNLPVLFNKYAEESVTASKGVVAVPPMLGETEEDPKVPRLSRNRSVPPDPTRYVRNLPVPKQEELEYWDEEEEDFEDSDYEEDVAQKSVPIWLCSSLVISYIVGGAFLFSGWESWNFLDSAYFCFITLTTIGFGDFVPTQGDSEVSIALCSLYLLFGIALLAMSFNLVQEQVINSVKKLAMTLGIIDEEET